MAEITITLDKIKTAIEKAAKRAGRTANEITLVAASKRVSLDRIQEAAQAGLSDFGENRVQEAIAKFEASGLKTKIGALHLIGPLQSNKVKKAVGFFDLIHSVDSLRLAERMEKEAARQNLVQDILIEVNIGGEASKQGVSTEETPALVEAIRRLSHLSLLGLMTLPPYRADPETVRPYFAALRKLGQGLALDRFSMGMSADFEVAIEEGASWVRIGTALFGKRAA